MDEQDGFFYDVLRSPGGRSERLKGFDYTYDKRLYDRRLEDSLSPAWYIRDGSDLLERGLYLEMQPWSYHVFNLEVSK